MTKILVVTRGGYITLRVLKGLFERHADYEIQVVIVKGDIKCRRGVHALRALCCDSEKHYLVYEMCQCAVFAVAGKVCRKGAFSVDSMARAKGLRTLICTDVNGAEVLEFARNFDPDLLLCVKCPQMIAPPLLQTAARCINIHGSLLPACAGRAPHFWAMANGEEITGSTAHFMTGRLDQGDILVQKAARIRPGTSAFEVLLAVTNLGNEVLLESLELAKLQAAGVPQDMSRRTYYSHPTPQAYREFRRRGYRLGSPFEMIRTIRGELVRQCDWRSKADD